MYMYKDTVFDADAYSRVVWPVIESVSGIRTAGEKLDNLD